MSAKLYALLLIGVVIGGCVGYGVSLVYTPQFLEDVLPNNYKTRLDELTQQYLDLSSRHEALTTEQEVLQEGYDELEGDHQDLEDDYSVLADVLANLTDDVDALTEAYDESLEEYDSLLMQYLIVTGSAPLTPQPLSNDTIRRDFAWVYGLSLIHI